jgi:hypothetical protein
MEIPNWIVPGKNSEGTNMREGNSNINIGLKQPAMMMTMKIHFFFTIQTLRGYKVGVSVLQYTNPAPSGTSV